jgi:PLD-like domain
MSIRLIYHIANDGLSPFDEAIHSIVNNNSDVCIVCPYLSLNYLQRIFLLNRSWRILTDVEEWLSSSSYESRQKIQGFVNQNSDSIRHCKDLHAKVIFAGDKALLGSANFTEKGITGRIEVSVLFEAEPQVEELKKWFENLWVQASPVLLSELDAYINSLPKPGKIEEIKKLTSNIPPIQAYLKDINPIKPCFKDIQNNPEQYGLYNRLIATIRKAPSREWIEGYFDLLQELIDFTGLFDGDPRLVLSITNELRLRTTINKRYVLGAFYKRKLTTGLIFKSDFNQLSHMLSIAADAERCLPSFSGETSETTPFFIHFEGLPQNLLTSKQKQAWKNAALLEVSHGSASSYRKHHASIVYQVATNGECRSVVLNEAFPELHTP